jgi:hypothetical protein
VIGRATVRSQTFRLDVRLCTGGSAKDDAIYIEPTSLRGVARKSECHFCAKEIQNASVVCEHCGRRLIPRRSAVAPAPDDVLNELERTPLGPSTRIEPPLPQTDVR